MADGSRNLKKGAKSISGLCSNPMCRKSGATKRCKRCLSTVCCSRACQKRHFTEFGHKKRCVPPPARPSVAAVDGARCPATFLGRAVRAEESTPTTRRTPAAAGDDPQHPCPICFENEDDDGQSAMCFNCGQLYCGSCMLSGTMPRHCPTCRADSHVSDEVGFERLLRMEKRSPGRHTPATYHLIGYAYYMGRGVPRNFAEAAKWYRLAADQGVVEAQCNLGQMCQVGEGVDQSCKEAIHLFQSAADKGDAQAQHSLGEMHREGLGVPQNHKEAAKWWRLAADQGDASAQCGLGCLHREGKGVAQSFGEALRWFRLAAAQGQPSAQSNIGSMHDAGEGVTQSFEQAIKWCQLAANQGDAAGQNNLAVMHRDGEGAKQSYETAIRLYRLAADQGFAAAQHGIGVMHYKGQGVPQDFEKAKHWMTLAANQSYLPAQLSMIRLAGVLSSRVNAADTPPPVLAAPAAPRTGRLTLPVSDVRCANSDCGNPQPEVRCSRCKARWCCDGACQKRHWKHQGHKAECTPATTTTS